MMQLISKDDKRTTTKRMLKDSSTLSCNFTVKMSEDTDAPRYLLEGVMFDFKGFGLANLHMLAARSLIIMVQAMARGMTRDEIQGLERVFVVKDMLDGTRAKATPIQKARTALVNLSDAEKKELIATLKADGIMG